MISLLLPTRGRPTLVARLFDSIAEKTRDLSQIEVVVYIDDDDRDSFGIQDTRFSVKVTIGHRLTMGGYNSACLTNASGDIAILINDDMVIRTQGWDDIVRELDTRFPDKVYLGYGNDLFKGSKLCTFPILSRKTCEILEKPFPVEYRGAFIDYHLLDIFKRLSHIGHDRICYLDNLVFEHLHYRTGKGQFDETYQKRGRYDDDPEFFKLRDERSRGARRLIQHIGETQQRPRRDFGIFSKPPNVLGALLSYAKAALPDDELPLRWRIFLFVWFVGRYLASKGYLGKKRK